MRTPPCPQFGICGGCTSQDFSHSEQLQKKKSYIAELLNIYEEEITIYSGKEFSYRTRMDFAVEKQAIGLRMKNSWETVIDIPHCKIANEKINIILNELRSWLPEFGLFDIEDDAKTFKNAVIRATGNDSCITFIVNKKSPFLKKCEKLVARFADSSITHSVIIGYVSPQSGSSISLDYKVVKGRDFLEEKLSGKTFRFHSQGFFQNNTEMAERMISYVRNIYEKTQNRELLMDIYGGVGSFGISFADLFDHVQIVESFTPSTDFAEKNTEINAVNNAMVWNFDADKLHYLPVDAENIHCIVDPPRSGMEHKAIKRLLQYNPNSIVYISCNPERFSQELSQFQHAGYTLKSTALFDLFPQTDHTELITVLIPN